MRIEKLEKFGKEFIENVRDVSLDQYFMIKAGKMKSEVAKRISELFSHFDESQKAIIDQIVINIIDRELHKMLFLFESTNNWSIVDRQEAINNKLETLAEISDGLSGELYTEDGWIAKYSQYPFDQQ